MKQMARPSAFILSEFERVADKANKLTEQPPPGQSDSAAKSAPAKPIIKDKS
jgi:hypothetical protein